MKILFKVVFGVFCCITIHGAWAKSKNPQLKALRHHFFLHAKVWEPINTSSLDLLNGPRAEPNFRFNELVECDFDEIKINSTGKTEKFYCKIRNGKYKGTKIKVKYGDTNNEVFAETAASRLFWALGFKAEIARPVRVKCYGCLPDPFNSKQMASVSGYQMFEVAMIDQPLDGSIIEEKEDQGWSWNELDKITDFRRDPQTLAEVDALKLLAAMIQHFDSKKANNALLCSKKLSPENLSQCPSSFLVVHDLGWSFGKGFNLANLMPGQGQAAANYRHWYKTPIWANPKKCIGNLAHLPKPLRGISFQMRGALRYPKISEEGRRLLAYKLSQLKYSQIRDLFRAGHFDLRTTEVRDPNGNTRHTTLDDWVALFDRKRAEIIHHPGCK